MTACVAIMLEIKKIYIVKKGNTHDVPNQTWPT